MKIPKQIYRNYKILNYDRQMESFRCYSKDHKRDVFLRFEKKQNIQNYIKKGWYALPSKQELKILRSPEAVLADLTEVEKNPCPLERIIPWFNFIKNNFEELIRIANGKMFIPEAKIIRGRLCETQIRVSIKEKHSNISQKLYRLAVELNLLPRIKILNLRQPLIHYSKIKNCINSKKMIADFKKCYTKSVKDVNDNNLCLDYLKSKILNDNVLVPMGFWKNIASLYPFDKFLFIFSSGFKYAVGFVEETNCKNIEFIEYHKGYNIDINGFRLKDINVRNKKICIIDSVYTGETINYISDKIKRMGGKPIKVGIFPKYRTSLRKLDYFVIIDKLLTYKDVYRFLKNNNWALSIFRNILN